MIQLSPKAKQTIEQLKSGSQVIEKDPDINFIHKDPNLTTLVDSPSPSGHEHEIRAHLKVLNRDSVISWDGTNPDTVYLDGIPFTVQEIQNLKSKKLAPVDLRNMLKIKTAFDGQVMA